MSKRFKTHLKTGDVFYTDTVDVVDGDYKVLATLTPAQAMAGAHPPLPVAPSPEAVERLRLVASAVCEELADRYDGAPDSKTLWMGRHIDCLNSVLAAVAPPAPKPDATAPFDAEAWVDGLWHYTGSTAETMGFGSFCGVSIHCSSWKDNLRPALLAHIAKHGLPAVAVQYKLTDFNSYGDCKHCGKRWNFCECTRPAVTMTREAWEAKREELIQFMEKTFNMGYPMRADRIMALLGIPEPQPDPKPATPTDDQSPIDVLRYIAGQADKRGNWAVEVARNAVKQFDAAKLAEGGAK